MEVWVAWNKEHLWPEVFKTKKAAKLFCEDQQNKIEEKKLIWREIPGKSYAVGYGIWRVEKREMHG